jgi:hypothetical protein
MKKIILISFCFIFPSDAKLFDFFGSKISKSDVEKNVNNLINFSKTQKMDHYEIPEIFISGISDKSIQKWNDFSNELRNYVNSEEKRLFPDQTKESIGTKEEEEEKFDAETRLIKIVNAFLKNSYTLVSTIKIIGHLKEDPKKLKKQKEIVNSLQIKYDKVLTKVIKKKLEKVKEMKLQTTDKKQKQMLADQEKLLYLVYTLGDQLRAKCIGTQVVIRSLQTLATK